MTQIVVGRSAYTGLWVWFQSETEAVECQATEVGPATPEEQSCATQILKTKNPPIRLGDKMGRLLALRDVSAGMT